MSILGVAASGLESQLARLDAESNNIANLDTAGYQRASVSFADTLTQVFGQSPAVSSLPDRQTPDGLSLGTGAYALPTARQFQQGTFKSTQNPLNMAVEGDGFFTVALQNGKVGYTRAGNFTVSNDAATGRLFLTTAGGNAVLDVNGKPIDVTGIAANTVQVSATGVLTGDSLQGGRPVRIGQLGLAYVGNPANALASVGADIYALNPGFQSVTNATAGNRSLQLMGAVKGATLETSNVNLTQEMTDLIQTQYDFQMSSKALNIADQMAGLADTIA